MDAAEIDCSKGTGYPRLAAFLRIPASSYSDPATIRTPVDFAASHPTGEDKQHIAEAIE